MCRSGGSRLSNDEALVDQYRAIRPPEDDLGRPNFEALRLAREAFRIDLVEVAKKQGGGSESANDGIDLVEVAKKQEEGSESANDG